MTLQEQCCTLEQGKQLKELLEARGVDIQATFWWMPIPSEVHQEYIHYGWHSGNVAPAFTVAELGQLLPFEMPMPDFANGKYLLLQHDAPWEEQPGYSSGYVEIDGDLDPGGCIYAAHGDTEAQARAALLIYLFENDLMTFKPDTATLAE